MKNKYVITIFCLAILLVMGCKSEPNVESDPNVEVYYTCSMHPQIHEKHMGKCPICHMDLTRVEVIKNEPEKKIKKASVQIKKYRCKDFPDITSEVAGECPIDGSPMIEVDSSVKKVAKIHLRASQLIHFHPAIYSVEKKTLQKEIRLLGFVKKATDKVSDIPAQIEGRVEKNYIDSVGRMIHRGDPLLDIYSSRLIAAGEEYILSRQSYEKLKRKDQKRLFQQAEMRLLQWGINRTQIEDWYRKKKVPNRITIYAHTTGVVDKMNASVGKYFKEGESYFQLSDLSTLWVELQVYEQDSARVKLGQKVMIKYNALSEREDEAKINFINPFIDPKTRTLTVRVTVNNDDGRLMPGMVADARGLLKKEKANIVVPRSTIIDTGKRKVVWKKINNSNYEAVEIQTGFEGDKSTEVVSGLKLNDQVVVDGNFLLDAQAQLFRGYEQQ